MGSHPRPHFFISRPDHTITPLIAVDELPDHIRINGVPALMSQADTQAMMSLGVKERSIGYYDVHLVKSLSSSSRSAEGPAKYTSPSGTDSSSKESDDVNHLKSPDKQKEHIEKTTAGSSSAQVIHHPDLIDEAEKTASLSKATHGEVGDQTSVDVEEWRQKIDNDETQVCSSVNSDLLIVSDQNRPRLTPSLLPARRIPRKLKRS